MKSVMTNVHVKFYFSFIAAQTNRGIMFYKSSCSGKKVEFNTQLVNMKFKVLTSFEY